MINTEKCSCSCKYVVPVLLFFAREGVHDFLMSLETNDAIQKEQKAAEKYRQRQVAVVQQQITELEERRDRLRDVVGQLRTDSVSCHLAFYLAAVTSPNIRVPFIYLRYDICEVISSVSIVR